MFKIDRMMFRSEIASCISFIGLSETELMKLPTYVRKFYIYEHNKRAEKAQEEQETKKRNLKSKKRT